MENNNDYLKYWRVVKYYIKAKYGLTQSDLEMLLFLKSESYFSKDRFAEFNQVFSWNKNRFENLRQQGWIEVFRKGGGPHKNIYQLSYKAKKMMEVVYKKLNGEEIATHENFNPMFKRNVSYSDKVYRNMIMSMNKETKEINLKKRGLM
jgi:hypothetical protein